MHGYYIFTTLILITTLFTYVNSKWIKLPISIAVTIFSLLISIGLLLLNSTVPQLNQTIRNNLDMIQFDEIVIDILLGFLLFAAAFRLDAYKFKKLLPTILSLAFVSTLLSTVIVGSLVYFSFQLFHHNVPYLNCLLFGAIISPTDPIASIAILKKLGISQRIELQITGESLINDGIAIVLFITLMQMMSPEVAGTALKDAVLLFLREAGGALLLGLVLGFVARLLLQTIADFKVEILITISIVMGGYTLARFIGVSPPLTMVVTGLVCSVGNKETRSRISHEFVLTFWEIVENFINVVLFLLIGVGVFVIPIGHTVLLIGGITILSLLVSRVVSLLPVYSILHRQFEKNAIVLLTWGGLRGAVSIALALTLPAYLHRREFLAITYIIAVFSIIFQGLTIKPLAKKLGFGGV